MSKTGIFFANGNEEIEGLTVVDILRRAGIEIESISIYDEAVVTGSHNITFHTDTTMAEADFDSYDAIVLPGGMPGTLHFAENKEVNSVIKKFAQEGKLVCAICAAPSVLGAAGILEGKKQPVIRALKKNSPEQKSYSILL